MRNSQAFHEGTKNHEDHENDFVQERFVFLQALRAFVKSVKPIRLACHDSRAAAQPREQLDGIDGRAGLSFDDLQRDAMFRRIDGDEAE